MNNPHPRSLIVRLAGLVVFSLLGLGDAHAQFKQLVNLSTRAPVGTGDNVLIGGFIINGTGPKRVVVRALGPTLAFSGIAPSQLLVDPSLELFSGGTLVARNDDWILGNQDSELMDLGLSPQEDYDSALIATLNPGAYTVIVRGVQNRTGISIVEVYDVETAAGSKLANISTRARAGTGDNVIIGGFIISGNSPKRVLIRGLGPTLTGSGVPSVLANPALELVQDDVRIGTNDDWKSTQQSDIQASGLAPGSDSESALIATLAPGAYTVILRGVNNTQGNGLVEVYDLD